MRTTVLASATLLCIALHAQNEEDVLRYSYLLGGGTARSSSMAGAMGGLGADLSAAAINPAGLGLYRNSEFAITLGLEFNKANAKHYGTSTSNNDAQPYVNDLGLVLSYGEKEGTPWKGSAFGVSFDRLNSYNWNTTAKGDRVGSTLLEQFAIQANGTPTDDVFDIFNFGPGLAYEAYAIDPDTSSTADPDQYVSAIPFGSPVTQVRDVDERGALNSTSFFFAANHDHKVFFGVAVGVIGIRYERYSTHTENTLDQTLALREFTYNEDLVIRGSGVDFKLGLIARPTEALRVGASIHTPMMISLSESYTYDFTSDFRDGRHFEFESEEGSFSYRINTPWRANASLAYIVGKKGLFSFDYEFADLSTGKLKRSNSLESGYDFSVENGAVRDRFTQLHTLKAGTEWRKNNWYVRAGVALTPDPYSDNDPLHGSNRMLYAGGVGYRTARMSLDLGVQSVQNEYVFQQYSPALVDPTSVQQSTIRSLVTFAYRP